MVNDLRRGTRLALGAAVALAAAREVLGRLREEDLSGQVAVVTGGSRGLGFLLARNLVREGCRVAICGRDAATLERARQRLEEEGGEVLAVVCDVSDRAQVEELVRRTQERFGPPDNLVTNAGVIQIGPVETQPLENYEQAMAVMYWGVVYPTLAVLPGMLERGRGRIVNVTSVGGKVAVPHLLPYSAAKFAATGFSEGLAAELAGTGVSVTTIAPGPMRTGSFVSVDLTGQHEREYAWFALSASLPGSSMSAERAARQIVTAAKRREPERILSTPATLLARFHGLMPGTTVRLLGVVDRLLPKPGGAGEQTAHAATVDRRMDSELFGAVTALGRAATRRYQAHERDGS